MKVTVRRGGEGRLTFLLAAAGFPLDLRCGGKGTCGRCRVLLTAGSWLVNGKAVDIAGEPMAVNACRTTLAGETGEVEVPELSLARGDAKSAVEWSASPLPVRAETVIGIDLGTTTVAAVKIRNGEVVARSGCFNSQNRFGDNVVTRINHAGTAEGVRELQAAAVADINVLLGELGCDGVSRIAVSGNTVMSLLLHGIDPTPIGIMPFTPPQRIFPVCDARELGIECDAGLLTVPAIAGYVGGDLTSGIAEVGLKPGEMLVDIGTNCEIIFRTREKLYSTAAAAGPAFEGAGIECGCRAAPGAIDHWFADGSWSVLGGVDPVGLCGSALIDFLAVMREGGRLNEFGRLEPAAKSFPVAPGLAIHEWEIAQLLKAKAAVFAGIQTLAEHCGEPVGRIWLAGGFARYIDLGHAVRIGMLPECEYTVVGNTSLAGAARLAAAPERLAQLERLIDEPEDIPLNLLPEFEDNFIGALLLP